MDFEKYADRARGFAQSAQSLALREGPATSAVCALTAANIISTDSRTYRPVFNIVVCEIARLERHCNPVHSGRGAFLHAERHARHLAGRAQTLQDARKPMHT